MTRTLVTGATGFIGPHLVAALQASGAEVTCLRRPGSDTARLPGDVRLVSADITAADSLLAAVQNIDVVYHLAGLTKAFSRRQFFRVNEGGVRNLLQACASQANPPVAVIVSSLAAAGPSSPNRLRQESDPPNPVSHYGRSKRAAELTAHGFANRLPITVVRPPLVFGEGDEGVLQIFRSIRRFGIHLAPGWRRHRFSLIHASDLTAALICAAQGGRRLQPLDDERLCPEGNYFGYYYAACDEHPTYADLGRRIGRTMGRRTRVLHTPRVLTWTAALAAEVAARCRGRPQIFNWDKAKEAAAGSWTCTSHRAQVELGWSCTMSLDQRLQQTADWYRLHRWL